MSQKGKHTTILVGAVIGVVLIWVAFLAAGWKVGAALSALLLYEGWTLCNNYPEDTISESIWRLSKRPMVPWIFGVGMGYLLALGYFGPVGPAVLGGAAFFLAGHFFFQKHEDEKRRKTVRVFIDQGQR